MNYQGIPILQEVFLNTMRGMSNVWDSQKRVIQKLEMPLLEDKQGFSRRAGGRRKRMGIGQTIGHLADHSCTNSTGIC